MANETFLDTDGHIVKKSSMVDEHQIIKINEKTPVLNNIGKIVLGDTFSNILTFEIKRYYDGVDLYTKNIKFIVKNELDNFVEDAVNLQYNSELLRFSWILSDAVTYKSGNVTAAIIFLGTEENNRYALKTVPFTIKIENSLRFLDVKPEYKNWFVDIESKLLELEDEIPNNKDILEKLNEADGFLTFNGQKIGLKGDPGTPAGFGTPTASVDSNVGTPSVTVSSSGSDTAKMFNFAFKNLKGEKGDKGNDGISPTPQSVANLLKSDSSFIESTKGATGATGEKGIKGDTGATGVSVVKVEQTTTSTADGGNNVVTVTLSNGATSTFNVKNGSKGDKGEKGEPGDSGNVPSTNIMHHIVPKNTNTNFTFPISDDVNAFFYIAAPQMEDNTTNAPTIMLYHKYINSSGSVSFYRTVLSYKVVIYCSVFYNTDKSISIYPSTCEYDVDHYIIPLM